jgi:transcriptional pleiotropic regulator of transition state genes
MNTLLTTHLDSMGRIVIPKEIRRINGWKINDLLHIQSDGNGIVTLTSASPRCCVCGCTENLKAVKEKYICSDCASSID